MDQDPFQIIKDLLAKAAERETDDEDKAEITALASAGLDILAQVVGSLNSIALSLDKIAESSAKIARDS